VVSTLERRGVRGTLPYLEEFFGSRGGVLERLGCGEVCAGPVRDPRATRRLSKRLSVSTTTLRSASHWGDLNSATRSPEQRWQLRNGSGDQPRRADGLQAVGSVREVPPDEFVTTRVVGDLQAAPQDNLLRFGG